MKVKELKEFLDQLDDDFKVVLHANKKIPQEQLDKMSYPYPIETTYFEIETGDIGYSDKIAQIHIKLDEPID